MAGIGAGMVCGYQIAINQINELGGIKSLGGAKIKLIVADTGANPDVAAMETERLITLENVAIVGTDWPTSLAGADIAERYKCPVLHQCGVAATTERGYKWIFHTCNTGKYDARECYQPWVLFPEELGIPYPESVYLMYNQDDAMTCLAEGLRPLLEDAGIEILGEEIVPPTPSTYVPQLIKIEALSPDAMYNCLYTPDDLILFKEMEERETYFPYGISSCGGGLEDPDFYEQMSPRSYEYLFVQEDTDAHPEIEPYFEYLDSKSIEMIGKPWFGHLPAAYTAGWVVKDVLERAEYSPNIIQYRENIRKAFTETDITKDNCPNCTATLPDGTTYCAALVQAKWERIKFDETGQNIYSHGQISQNIDDTRVIIWPYHQREAGQPGIVLPIPPWSER